jgi:hypothetical protein
MEEIDPPTTGHKTQAFVYGTIISALLDNIFYNHIFPLSCRGRRDETLLFEIHCYMQVSESWKVATSTNWVWHAFQVNNADVVASLLA